MRLIKLAALALGAMTTGALAGDPTGRWQSEPNDEGGYILVDVGPCAGDAAKLCGVISAAKDGDGADARPEWVGKRMIWDMSPDGENEWSGGRIWAPDEDETYRSKMELAGSNLKVSGCVLGGLFCRAQTWIPAE
jgi:uncharacterized protein (DUF2147 family)